MKIFTGAEWEEKHNSEKMSFHYLDCPARYKFNSVNDNLIFGLRNFFLAHPKESELLIEFSLDELNELKELFNQSYNTLKNYLESGEE